MYYWKQGFTIEPIEGAVPVSPEEWLRLLQEQSSGKQIVDDGKGNPIAVPYIMTDSELEQQALDKRALMIGAVEWRRSRHSDEISLGLTPTEDILPVLRYIQALRDITKQPGFPSEIQWPEIPGEEGLE